jgi:hypothetical protein
MMRSHQGIDSSFSQTSRCIQHQVILLASKNMVPTISASVSCETLGSNQHHHQELERQSRSTCFRWWLRCEESAFGDGPWFGSSDLNKETAGNYEDFGT